MNIQDVPRDFRYWVRHEGLGYEGATAWTCFGCAINSIPAGTARIVTDRLAHCSQYVCKPTASMISVQNVDLNADGWVVKEFGAPMYISVSTLPSVHAGPGCAHIDIEAPAPTRFGRAANDLPDPAVAVATAERILKEARA